jgi:hypothetical protein
MLHGTSLVITNPNDNLFDEDFAEDTQMNHLFDEELLYGTIIGETQRGFAPTFDSVEPDFEGVRPECIMQHLKLIKPKILKQFKLKPFYKSYCSWEKLSNGQRHKTVSFYHKLPEQQEVKFILKSDSCYILNM